MIDQLRANEESYSVSELCDAFSVSRSGYYAARSKRDNPSQRKRENAALVEEMKEVHRDRHMKNYGSPRMTVELQQRGFECSENRVARLMSSEGIKAPRKSAFRPKTTIVDSSKKPSPNLLAEREKPSKPGEVLVSDITYVATKEGWLYLAVVIDLYSRAVIGWELAEHMKTSLVTTALARGVLALHCCCWGIFHSDRGSQYTSKEMRSMLKTLGLKQSMSAKGYCYDNATAESFFATLKREAFPPGCCFDTKAEARVAIFHYLESFYNRRRRHSSLDHMSPAEFLEQQGVAV